MLASDDEEDRALAERLDIVRKISVDGDQASGSKFKHAFVDPQTQVSLEDVKDDGGVSPMLGKATLGPQSDEDDAELRLVDERLRGVVGAPVSIAVPDLCKLIGQVQFDDRS